ncbi:MAG: hypothetical protein JST28_21925 [Acidobacteria bacterium]|nr:hypothetical protein [Acidobacteriota bacterium]
MIPVGYMAKSSVNKPPGFELACVEDVYSVSSCVNDDFADYIDSWKHNGFWLFDSPEVIREVACEMSVSLDEAMLFYYEAYELEFDEKHMKWSAFGPETGFMTNIVAPLNKRLEGFDPVTFYARSSPECSPLSCCSLANDVPTNEHCLVRTFEEAKKALEEGKFSGAEPGPYRIFAVYTVEWPGSTGSVTR